MIVCLIDFLISFAILLVLMVVYRFMPRMCASCCCRFFLLLALVTALGSGLLIAALNVKYRDFRYIMPFIVQFGLYVSPVAFSSRTSTPATASRKREVRLRAESHGGRDRWVPLVHPWWPDHLVPARIPHVHRHQRAAADRRHPLLPQDRTRLRRHDLSHGRADHHR
jgi:hypothetical protein